MARRSSVFNLGLVLSLGLTLTLLSACGLPKAEKNGKNQAISKIDIAPISFDGDFDGQQFSSNYAGKYLAEIFKNNPYDTWIFNLDNIGNGILSLRSDDLTVDPSTFNNMLFSKEVFFGTTTTLTSKAQSLETKALAILKSKSTGKLVAILYHQKPESDSPAYYKRSDYLRCKDKGNFIQMLLAYNYSTHTALELIEFTNGLTYTLAERDNSIKTDGTNKSDSLADKFRQVIEEKKLYDKQRNKSAFINRKIELTELATGSLEDINNKLSTADNNYVNGLDHTELFKTYQGLQLFAGSSNSAKATTVLAQAAKNRYLFLNVQGPIDKLDFTENPRLLSSFNLGNSINKNEFKDYKTK